MTTTLSVSEFRKNLAGSFDRAVEGDRVLIRRKNQLYALVSLGEEEINLSSRQKHEIDELRSSLRRSLEEVKEIEAGRMMAKSIDELLNEL